MAKTIPITASRAGLGCALVVDSAGITKTQALSASRAGAGGSVFSADDGSGKAYSQSAVGVASSSNDLNLNKSWFIPGIGVESAGSGAGATALPALLPALVTDGDGILITNVGWPLSVGALVIDSDAFFNHSIVAEIPGHGTQHLRWALLTDSEVIFASAIGASLKPAAVVAAAADVVYPAADITAVKGSAFIPSDDAVYSLTTTLFLQPSFVTDGDGILRADVGWKLFGQLLIDVDLVLNPQAESWNYIVPQLYRADDSIDTYPFFLQRLEGGIPVPPSPDVLTGSLSPPRRVLTGSLKRTTRLTGSIRAGARRSGVR